MQDKYNHTEVERAAHAHWTASDAYRVTGFGRGEHCTTESGDSCCG